MHAGVEVAGGLGRVGDAGGAGDELDVAGDLQQPGDEGGLEGPDLRCPGLEAGQFAGEDVVVLAPPPALPRLTGEGDQCVAFGAVDAIQLAQVDDLVGDRLDPPGLFQPVELGSRPAKPPLHIGGRQVASLAQLDQPPGQRALADGGAVTTGPGVLQCPTCRAVLGGSPGPTRGKQGRSAVHAMHGLRGAATEELLRSLRCGSRGWRASHEVASLGGIAPAGMCGLGRGPPDDRYFRTVGTRRAAAGISGPGSTASAPSRRPRLRPPEVGP